HDLYTVGQGQVLVIRRPMWNDHWYAMLPAIMEWSGIRERLCDSDDRYMQMHVLQHGAINYLVTTHRAHQQSGYDGPEQWSGKVRFTMALPAGSYRVTEMMSGQELGVATPAQLAAGFEVGAYSDLQMKIFKIAPVK
ncbi:MAG TPA: hypothetical protein VGL77_18355, partial [Armatimonadota bacterium]